MVWVPAGRSRQKNRTILIKPPGGRLQRKALLHQKQQATDVAPAWALHPVHHLYQQHCIQQDTTTSKCTHRVFRPELKVALGEVRHGVHDFLHGEVADILFMRCKRQPVRSLLRGRRHQSKMQRNESMVWQK